MPHFICLKWLYSLIVFSTIPYMENYKIIIQLLIPCICLYLIFIKTILCSSCLGNCTEAGKSRQDWPGEHRAEQWLPRPRTSPKVAPPWGPLAWGCHLAPSPANDWCPSKLRLLPWSGPRGSYVGWGRGQGMEFWE